LLPHSIQALLDCGPDLIDTFISGGALISRARYFSPDGADRLDRLQELVARRAKLSGSQGRDQSRIFEQYAGVLRALATRQPLLLILDDLHWADLSSISLLVHLGQRIGDRPILVISAFRPEEVAQGRGGGQHPLEAVLSEFKRHSGNICVDLDRDEPGKGRAFVDALLDTEPNRLGEDFRHRLARRSGGHPLFTIELLRDLQERGDLQRDENGCWLERPGLGWDTLPARVEGVIEKRIGRLDSELRNTLAAASVEGEEFTAEVVARVREVDERELVRRLSGELDRQHRLVKEQGIKRLEPGAQRLSRYRFRHNLFRKYLYDGLGRAERSYLHEAIGVGLETIYGDHVEQIAVRLARHFQEAGLIPKAIDYFQMAGDAAAQVYANAEAIASYRQALTLAGQSDARSETLGHLYTNLGRVLELDSQFEAALANYEEMERVARQHGDSSMCLTALVHQSQIRCTANALFDPEQGAALSERALALAQELNDGAAEAKVLWIQQNLYMWTNKMAQGIDAGERSLALAREFNLREQMAFTLNDLAYLYSEIAELAPLANSILGEASDLWRELGNLPMLADSLSSACLNYAYAGDYEAAVALSEEAFQIGQASNNVWGKSYSRYMVGLVYWNRGELDRAIEVMEESIRLGEQAGFLVPGVITRAYLASVYGDLGVIEVGIEIANKAVVWAKEHFPEYYLPFTLAWLAQLHLLNGDTTEAAAIFQRADDASESLSDWYVQLLTWVKSQLASAQGEYDQALALAAECLAGLRRYNTRIFIPDLLYLQGQTLLAMGQKVEAYQCLVEARAEAEALGSRRTLWKILAALSELEVYRGNLGGAESLLQQAQEAVAYIADHSPTPELRASFRSLPRVQAVFEPNK
jgi:tetratricopeptide (TPR) repeat protein